TRAEALITGNVVAWLVPTSEVTATNPLYRVSVFQDMGDFGVRMPWSASLDPTVAQGLTPTATFVSSLNPVVPKTTTSSEGGSSSTGVIAGGAGAAIVVAGGVGYLLWRKRNTGRQPAFAFHAYDGADLTVKQGRVLPG